MLTASSLSEDMITLGEQRAHLLIEIGLLGRFIAFAREHQRDARFVCGAQGQMRALIRGEPAKEQRIIAFVGAEWPLVDAQRIVNPPNPIQVRRQLALSVADRYQADLVAKFAVIRVQSSSIGPCTVTTVVYPRPCRRAC